MGDSILIFVIFGEYELVGNFILLKSYVLDLEEEEKKILDVVKRQYMIFKVYENK